MKRLFINGLCAAFTVINLGPAQAQTMDNLKGERAKIERLQKQYDDLYATSSLKGALSQIIIMPQPEDIITYNEFDIRAHNAETRLARFMVQTVKNRFHIAALADVISQSTEKYKVIDDPEKIIEKHILRDLSDFHDGSISERPPYTPLSISALVKNYNQEFFACFTAMPDPSFDLKDDIKGFLGLETGGFRTPSAAFEYDFDVPISDTAWQNFRAHYAVSQCLIDDRNNPNLSGYRLSDTEDFALSILPIAFAAVMSARDGHPEIMEFLADLYAATIHNSGSYNLRYNYAQILEKGIEIDGMGTTIRAQQRGGSVFITNPIDTLDSLNKMWNENDILQTSDIGKLLDIVRDDIASHITKERIYAFIRATQYIDENDESAAIPSSYYDEGYFEILMHRAFKGSLNLDMCVTPSEYWSRPDKDLSKYKRHKSTDFLESCTP